MIPVRCSKLCWLVFVLAIWSVPDLSAAETILSARHTHQLSDNETKNDARRLCFLQARQKLISRVVDAYFADPSNVPESMDEKTLRPYLSVLLDFSTRSESWDYANDQLAVTVDVQAAVDMDKIKKQIPEVRRDKEVTARIRKDQSRLQALEKEYAALGKQLETSDRDTVLPLRKERQVISAEMDRIEKVRYLIASKTKLVSDKITTGMTIDEVITIAGQPRATATCEKPDFLNYGNVWVWINNGIVIGKIPIQKWSGPCYRYGSSDRKAGMADSRKAEKSHKNLEKPKYAIWLKTGQTIFTSSYYEVNDIIYYKKYGGIIGIEKEKVETIEDIE